MKIYLNAQPHETSATTLAEALAEAKLADAKVATALNGTFVPANKRVDTPLAEGDKIEIVAPMKGG